MRWSRARATVSMESDSVARSPGPSRTSATTSSRPSTARSRVRPTKSDSTPFVAKSSTSGEATTASTTSRALVRRE